jgi:BMFP domain-containing protein YqiC
MQTRNRFLDDFARLASGAMGAAAGVKGEVEGRLHQQFERILADMDLVTREEFDAVKAMAQKAREEQEALNDRLRALERELQAKGKARPASGKRPSTRKSTAKT